MSAGLSDHVLGAPVALWRLRHAEWGELVCLAAQPRPGWCTLRWLHNGAPLRYPPNIVGRRRVQRSPRVLDAALRYATDVRNWLIANEGWKVVDGDNV